MSSDRNSNWVTRDLAHVWHPCTQMKDHETVPLIPLRAGSGVWLEDFSGKRYLDGISSWWVNLFGHANESIGAAVAAQLGKLEHVIFAGFTHEPAVQLAEVLLLVEEGHDDADLRGGGCGRERQEQAGEGEEAAHVTRPPGRQVAGGRAPGGG